MPRFAAASGLALIVLGLAAYFISGQASLTALIPVPFGIAMALLGGLAKRATSTKHAMHAAAVVALIGFLGTAGALPEMVRLALGEAAERPVAVGARSVMAVVLAIFLALCIRSFRQARKGTQ